MEESLETIMARFDERQKANNEMTLELLRIVKGDNGEGLSTRVSKIEQTQENCPKIQEVRSSLRWLKWGFRLIISGIIGGFLWMIRQ